MSASNKGSWDTIINMAAAGQQEELETFIFELPEGDRAQAVAELSDVEQTQFLNSLDMKQATNLLSKLPDSMATGMLTMVNVDVAAELLENLSTRQRNHVIEGMDPEASKTILSILSRELDKATKYAPLDAGAMMDAAPAMLKDTQTLGDVLNILKTDEKSGANYKLPYLYVVNKNGVLVGSLSLRRLLVEDVEVLVAHVMDRDVPTIKHQMDLGECRGRFEAATQPLLPVVNDFGHMLGLLWHGDVQKACAERYQYQVRTALGIMGEQELRSMPLVERCMGRIGWLGIRAALGVIAIGLLAVFLESFTSAFFLVIFVPFISGVSISAGMQALSVSLYEEGLGLPRSGRVSRILKKEIGLGLLLGLFTGLICGGTAYLWKKNVEVGLILGLAMVVTTWVAVCLGGALPMALQKKEAEPSIASGPLMLLLIELTAYASLLGFARLFFAP